MERLSTRWPDLGNTHALSSYHHRRNTELNVNKKQESMFLNLQYVSNIYFHFFKKLILRRNMLIITFHF